MGPSLGLAQSVVGTWQGAMTLPQNESVQLPATLVLRQAGDACTGELTVELNGTRETYAVQASRQQNRLMGTATYPEQRAVYQFEAMPQAGKLLVGVGLPNGAAMGGVFTRQTASTAQRPGPPSGLAGPDRADGLPRNNRLVGAWAHSRYYGSGDFYGSVRTTLVFYPDGRLGSGESSASAGMGGSSVSSDSEGVQVLEGVRWYTKAPEQIWIRAVGGGADRLYAEYGMSADGQKILLYRNGGKQLYKRIP